METEKSHDLLSATWGSRKADGVDLVYTCRPKDQGSLCYKSGSELKDHRTRSASSRDNRIWVPHPSQRAGSFFLIFLFYSGPCFDDAHPTPRVIFT